MKKIIYTVLIASSFASLATSCNDWLLELPAGTKTLKNYYDTGGSSVEPVVNGCYVPTEWEYGGNPSTFFSEWLIGDVCSDDAIKGGENRNDMEMVLDMELFRVNPENTMLLSYYWAQYIGISRCNRAIEDIPSVPVDENMSESKKARMIAEAKFLRAFYHLRLVRIFGRVPYVDRVFDGASELTLPRATYATIYNGIVKDLTEAEADLWEKSEYAAEDLGRATKGAAQALLLKTYLTGREYLGGSATAFAEAVKWGEKLETGGEYTLNSNYWDNFSLAGENGPESVFEIQYTNEATSDYGNDAPYYGATRGSFTLILQRPRAKLAIGGFEGWGYNRPSADLVAEYETGDPRKDVTIYMLKDTELSNRNTELYEGKIAATNLKYAMKTDGPGGIVYRPSHSTHGPLNHKEIRYADALLMYAEACVETGDLSKAKTLLESVRARARGTDSSILPEFPNYVDLTTGSNYTDDAGGLRKAIRHERRVELAMEGHRWFDITRWYPLDASGAEVLTTSPDPEKKYLRAASPIMKAFRQLPEIEDLYPDMGEFRDGVHEIFPIPAEERRLSGIDQNYGY